MERIHSDKLFQLLHKVKHHPELLTKKKSLITLENYILGYVNACRDHDEGCFTSKWYDAFCDYIAHTYNVKDKFFSISSVIEAMGYNDCDGVSVFMTMLEEFASKFDHCIKGQENRSKLKKGEIRVFRLDKLCMMDFSTKYIQDHCKELFGISPDIEQHAWIFNWNSEYMLTCALCENEQDTVLFSQNNNHIANVIKELPVFSVADKVNYTVVETTF